GEYYMSLPVPVAVGGFPRVVLGSGWIRDANATFPAGVAPIVIDLALGTDPTGSVARFIVESTQTVRSSGPWTWAAGDELMGECSYPAIWPNGPRGAAMPVPFVDARPGGLDVLFRPGSAVTVVLEWPEGSLDGRTFTSTLGDDPLAVTV